jgi:alkaline phosphatase D
MWLIFWLAKKVIPMLILLAISTLLFSALFSPVLYAKAPSRILFGSCSHQDKDIPILRVLLRMSLKFLFFLGTMFMATPKT